MKKFLIYLNTFGLLLGGLTACSQEEDVVPPIPQTASATIRVGMNPQTRAAEKLDLGKYTAKMYLFEGSKDTEGILSFTYVKEEELVKENEEQDVVINLENLKSGVTYKAVFLAKETKQVSPDLPSFTMKEDTATPEVEALDDAETPGTDTEEPGETEDTDADKKLNYTDLVAGYINGNSTDIDKNIFRSILTFTAKENGQYETVLTRQNGALEIRLIDFDDVQSVTLYAKSHKEFFLHDGTGGQVLTSGEPVPLVNTLTFKETEDEESEGKGSEAAEGDEDDVKTSNTESKDIRIRINLLPQEDITSRDGKDFMLEVVTKNGTILSYPIVSDHPFIPIYPNQVTWLTLKGDIFTVNFSSTEGGIHLDGKDWDGWNGIEKNKE